MKRLEPPLWRGVRNECTGMLIVSCLFCCKSHFISFMKYCRSGRAVLGLGKREKHRRCPNMFVLFWFWGNHRLLHIIQIKITKEISTDLHQSSFLYLLPNGTFFPLSFCQDSGMGLGGAMTLWMGSGNIQYKKLWLRWKIDWRILKDVCMCAKDKTWFRMLNSEVMSMTA